MALLSDIVDIPSNLNSGLKACTATVLLKKFGSPGQLTKKCSPFVGPSKSFIKTQSVDPFKVTGMTFAVDSLIKIFSIVQEAHPDVFAAVKTAGMLCVRANKANPSTFSNHSWGCAIDLFFGDEVVPFGTAKTQLGFLYMYETFRQEGWYWGAGFSGKKDAMHFELSRQAIDLVAPGASPAGDSIAASDYIAEMGYNENYEDA